MGEMRDFMRVAIVEDMDENIATLQTYLERYGKERSTEIQTVSYKDGIMWWMASIPSKRASFVMAAGPCRFFARSTLV